MPFTDVLGDIEKADAADAEATPEGSPKAEEGTPAVETPAEGEAPEAKTEKVTYEEDVQVDETPAEEPSSEGEPKAPQPVELSDDTMVKDPVTGELAKWGDIKNERLMQADYTRKTQALAEEKKSLESALETQTEEAVEQTGEEDPLSHLDPDDPLVAAIKQTQAQLQAVLQQNEVLSQQVEGAEERRNREHLEGVDAKLLEQFPVLDSEELDACGMLYLSKVQRGEEPDYEEIVAGRAEKLMKMQAGSVEKWKEDHRRPSPAEPDGAPAGGEPPKGPSAKEFMEGGIADRLRDEDDRLAREANK